MFTPYPRHHKAEDLLPKIRRLKCPYCREVFEHTDLMGIERRVYCKRCKKVFHADARNNSYPIR